MGRIVRGDLALLPATHADRRHGAAAAAADGKPCQGAASGETEKSCGVAAAPRCERQGSTELPGSVESVTGAR
eukprot:scaffold53137_cov55-Phaeocystis_antarctica.AAC.3